MSQDKKLVATEIDDSIFNSDVFDQVEKSMGTPSQESFAQPIQKPSVSSAQPNQTKALHKNISRYVVDLPSQGKYYPSSNSFHGVSQVEMRKIVGQDADIIRSPKLLKDGTAFIRLLNNLILDKDLNAEDLFDGDLYALLFAARAKTLGSNYDPGFKYKCEYCDSEFNWAFDLTKLEVILPSSSVRSKDNLFEVKLPVSEQSAIVKLLTAKEERELTEIITSINKHTLQEGIDKTETATIRHHVVSIGGETDPSQLNDIVQWLDLYDLEFIKQFIAEVEPRLNFIQSIQCSECSGTMERRIPLTERLFAPKLK